MWRMEMGRIMILWSWMGELDGDYGGAVFG